MNNTDVQVSLTHDTSLHSEELSTLRRLGFVRASERGQWVILLNEAWHNSHLPIIEEVRDYLALLLERTVRKVEIMDVLLGFEYYRNILSPHEVDERTLRDLADISLLHVSLFPGRIAYRHYPTSIKQSVDLGVGMYALLERREGETVWKDMYHAMRTHYMRAVMVLKFITPHLCVQEEKLRRLYGEAVRFPGAVEAELWERQKTYFEALYLKRGYTA